MTAVVDKVGLLAILTGLTDLSPAAMQWGLDPTLIVGDQDRAKVELTIFSIIPVGVDEHRRVLSDGTDGYPANTWYVTEIGNREIIVNVLARTYDKSVEAAELVDQIRTRVRAEAVTARLDAIAIAFQWASNTVMQRTVEDNREVSVASADFKFGGIARWVSVIDPTGAGWIATVNSPNLDGHTNGPIPGDFS